MSVQSQLVNTERGLVLQHALGELHIDFVNDKQHYFKKLLKGKNELLARALGVSSGVKSVWDLSAGLCEDSIFMLKFGIQVHAVERNPTIFALLEDAYQRALEEREDLQRLTLKNANALEILSSIPSSDCIYFDPMFDVSKSKTALPRKQMQIFRDLVGPDMDCEEVLSQILQSHKGRVVVKRPLKGNVLVRQPSHSFKGTSIRYDMYLG